MEKCSEGESLNPEIMDRAEGPGPALWIQWDREAAEAPILNRGGLGTRRVVRAVCCRRLSFFRQQLLQVAPELR